MWVEATNEHAHDVYAHFGFEVVEEVVIGQGNVDKRGNLVPVPFSIPSPMKYVNDIRSFCVAQLCTMTPWIAGMKIESPRTPYIAERKGR